MNTPAPPPLLTADLPGIGGITKHLPEDFEVEEIPAYEPSGQGEHLFLWIEKRAMGAEFFARQVAKRLGIAPGDVGTAGLKDRHAIARQWVSVPAAAESALAQLDGEGIRVLKVSRHTNKLRPGHLHGNRFRILVRNLYSPVQTLVEPILERIRALGLPNFFGPQRFGHEGETLALGQTMLRGERSATRPSPFLRKLALSAAQSWLFNEYLARRMNDGFLRKVLPGDVLAKWPAGGMFIAEDIEREQARFEAREVVSAGPIFGRKTFAACGLAGEREAAVLQAAELAPECFAGFGKLMQGTRRHNLIYIDDLSATPEPEGLRLVFTLPPGSYATLLLREVMKIEMNDEE
ncbi:MAG TPA: tRNA pseudouridine(13) synthase TruD [Gemmataceae bacterium]|jgi:tRNA pseudouridine13 synthase|nr:tRNA pseudouridine(13) synthase TruD [Gemmataceae bacterium]